MANSLVNTDKNYEELAAAIVKRAIKDYEKGRNLIRDYGKNKKSKKYINGLYLINDTTNFFHSQYFTLLAKVDGPSLFREIERNYEQYGKCIPFEKVCHENTFNGKKSYHKNL